MSQRGRVAVFIAIVQSVLFLEHGFLYGTWVAFWMPGASGLWQARAAFTLLSIVFVPATLLAMRSRNILSRACYTLAALWLGFSGLSFVAGLACWCIYDAGALLGIALDRRTMAVVFLGLALIASAYGVVNAFFIRVNRITVKLPGLPESWRGRVAALVSDTHLGPIRGHRFVRRVIRRLAPLVPDIIFIAGDLYDGTAADLNRLAEPWSTLAAPWGTYFVTGNHEEFSDPGDYLVAVRKAGIRVLDNEKVIVDGLQIVGVHYGASTNSRLLRAILRNADLAREQASILLTHAPDRPGIAAEAGISLQLSGHTHGGQMVPFIWILPRIYGRFTHGLNRLGNLLVYTSCGAGTWGPPMRLGTNSEIALICFE